MLATIAFAAVTAQEKSETWHTVLWVLALCLFVYGIYLIFGKREIVWGVAAIIASLLVGPGGVSLFS